MNTRNRHVLQNLAFKELFLPLKPDKHHNFNYLVSQLYTSLHVCVREGRYLLVCVSRKMGLDLLQFARQPGGQSDMV